MEQSTVRARMRLQIVFGERKIQSRFPWDLSLLRGTVNSTQYDIVRWEPNL